MVIAVALISLLIGAGLVSGVAYTARSVERAAHAHAVALVTSLLGVEQARTADLLTRLAARSLPEYQAAMSQYEDPTPRRQYITDDTGLIAVELDDDEIVVI